MKCGHLDLTVWVETDAWGWDGGRGRNGDGLTDAERDLWQSRRALVGLVSVLLLDEAFVADLSHVRSAHDRRARAWQMARRYGIAKRRQLLAGLMMCAAEHEDLEAAGIAMCNFGAVAISSTDEPQSRRPSTYLMGDASRAPIQHGCELLAQKRWRWGRTLGKHEERRVRRMVATILFGVRRQSLPMRDGMADTRGELAYK